MNKPERMPPEMQQLIQKVIDNIDYPITVELNLLTSFYLVATIQVALRHPLAEHSPAMTAAREVCNAVIAHITEKAPHGPEIAKVLLAGFDPANDIKLQVPAPIPGIAGEA